MTILFSNNASTTVSGSITAASTTVMLAAGTGVLFPNPTGGNYYCATFYDQATKTQNEIVHVTAMSGDTATIVRAQEGTTAKAWSAGDIFANLVTAGTLNAFVQAGTGPASTAQIYVGTDTSITPNLVIANTNPVPASLAVGMVFDIKVANTTTAAVNLQLNGGASIAAVRTDGSPMVGGNLVAGENYFFIYNGVNFTSTIPPIPAAPPQTVFYVRTDGNDSNDGFSNTPSHAFLTLQGAVNAIQARYISQAGVTIRVADGTYNSGIGVGGSYIAGWNVIGNTASPGNVIIVATSTNPASYVSGAPYGTGASSSVGARLTLSGFTFQSYDPNVFAVDGGYITISNCNFTAPVDGNSAIIAGGGYLFMSGTCSFSGATHCASIFSASNSGILTLGSYNVYQVNNLTFNISGSPSVDETAGAFTSGVIGIENRAVTFTGGTPVGNQYNTSTAGGIFFSTGVTTIFPGTLAGVVTSPGWIN